MRSTKILSIVLFVSINIFAQPINIIPWPASLKQPKIAANFNLTPTTEIVLEGSNMDNSVNSLNNYLQRFYLFKLKVVKNSTSKNAIRLNFERLDNELPGAYHMTVDGKGVYIAGDNEDGIFYGIQTLIQLLPVPNLQHPTSNKKLTIPHLTITDYPRFGYRGLHFDVSRHFFPVAISKLILIISLYIK